MNGSAGWCVWRSGLRRICGGGTSTAGSLRARCGIYETGVRNLPEPESVSSSAYQRTAYREAGSAREGCALIVARFQTAASSWCSSTMCARARVHNHLEEHLLCSASLRSFSEQGAKKPDQAIASLHARLESVFYHLTS